MATLSLPEFLQALRQCEALEASHWSLVDAMKRRFPDPESLGQEMVRLTWLSQFQLDHILQGDAAALKFGVYRLLDWLGEGGVSEVLKAWHTRQERLVALKILKPSLQEDEEAVKQFRFEARVISRLSHPNIVIAVDCDPAKQPFAYAMEYVEGTDLGRLVEEGGPVAAPVACDYIRQAARGLQYAYELGVVHRDIKPANLLLTHGDLLKILDMGLARVEWFNKGSYAGNPSNTSNLVMGTPDFVAPEQATRPKEADIRADIYSLGCTLFYLIAGQPPYPVRSIAQKLVCHQQAPVPKLEAVAKDVPPGLSAVIQKMMAKEPADRYRTPAGVVAALGGFCRAPVAVAR